MENYIIDGSKIDTSEIISLISKIDRLEIISKRSILDLKNKKLRIKK